MSDVNIKFIKVKVSFDYKKDWKNDICGEQIKIAVCDKCYSKFNNNIFNF